MKVSTKNEYGQLKSVILGRPTHANWPKGDLFFDRMLSLSTFKGKLQKGPISEDILKEANDELLYMKDILGDHDVSVFRPEIKDYTQKKYIEL